MDNVLSELFYGYINISDTVYSGESYKNWHLIIDNIAKELEVTLNDEQKRILGRLLEQIRDYRYDCGNAFFEEGFKLASRIMVKSLLGSVDY